MDELASTGVEDRMATILAAVIAVAGAVAVVAGSLAGLRDSGSAMFLVLALAATGCGVGLFLSMRRLLSR